MKTGHGITLICVGLTICFFHGCKVAERKTSMPGVARTGKKDKNPAKESKQSEVSRDDPKKSEPSTAEKELPPVDHNLDIDSGVMTKTDNSDSIADFNAINRIATRAMGDIDTILKRLNADHLVDPAEISEEIEAIANTAADLIDASHVKNEDLRREKKAEVTREVEKRTAQIEYLAKAQKVVIDAVAAFRDSMRVQFAEGAEGGEISRLDGIEAEAREILKQLKEFHPHMRNVGAELEKKLRETHKAAVVQARSASVREKNFEAFKNQLEQFVSRFSESVDEPVGDTGASRVETRLTNLFQLAKKDIVEASESMFGEERAVQVTKQATDRVEAIYARNMDNLRINAAYVEREWNIRLLRSIYHKGYAFPEWVLYFNLRGYLSTAVVYYDATTSASEGEAVKLATEREPVNIQMNRYYDEKKMEESFGWARGAYNERSGNIAIYVKTPIKIGDLLTEAHVINAIAPALDVETQKDYLRLHPMTVAERNAEYRRMLESAFNKIFHCYKSLGFEYLVMTGLGQSAFKKLAPSLGIRHGDIFKQVYENVFKSDPNVYINYYWLEGANNLSENIDDLLMDKNGWEADKVLFVNAWDPWSIIGNGNEEDDSLDGWFGRLSAMGVLGWPVTNPNIRYQPVDVA